MSKVLSPAVGSAPAEGLPSRDEATHPRAKLQRSLRDLQRAVALSTRQGAPPHGAIVETLAAVRAALAEHVGLTEGEDGAFENILRRSDWLAEDVEQLRLEHVTLRARLDEMVDSLAASAGRPLALRRVRRTAPRLVEDVEAHRFREGRLIFWAYVAENGD